MGKSETEGGTPEGWRDHCGDEAGGYVDQENSAGAEVGGEVVGTVCMGGALGLDTGREGYFTREGEREEKGEEKGKDEDVKLHFGLIFVADGVASRIVTLEV